jgi:hypothetical protein
MNPLRPLLLTGLSLLVLLLLLSPGVAWAQDGDPPDDPPDDGDSGDGSSESIITHIFRLIFPVETMQAATETLLINILLENVRGLGVLFDGLVRPLSLQNPGIKTPSQNSLFAARDMDVFVPTWSFTVKIAVALWPATLAIMAAAAAKESAISTNWGVAGLKGALAQWVGGVLACAFSLEVLDLANRLSNALIGAIVELPIGGGADLSTVVNLLLGAPLSLDTDAIGLAAAIVIIAVEMVLGLAVVISLIGQYFARIALLYVIVALAPVVLVIGILRPARWLQWLWLKGVLLVMLLGPITALLLKLLGTLFVALFDSPLLLFIVTIALASMLLTINGAIIRGIFGAAVEVLGRARETAAGVAQGAATAVAVAGAAVLTGGAALGVLPAWAGSLGGVLGSAAGRQPTSTPTASSSSSGQAARDAVMNVSASPAPSEGGSGPATRQEGGVAQGGVLAGGACQGEGPRATEPRRGAAEEAPSTRVELDVGGSPGYLGQLRRRWNEAESQERTQAVGAGLRAAGGVLGPRSLAGRTAGAIGTGLQSGARRQGEDARTSQRGPVVQASGANLAALSPDEIRGYQSALDDVRRDLRTPMEAAGLDLRQVEQDALAPVWAAAQHDTLSNVARQAGFGDRGDTASTVGDFVAYRVEGQLMAQGFLSERITRPGAQPSTPLSDSPALLDYDRGQQIAWAVGGGDMGAYAGLHHALRRYAETPAVGAEAAEGFYTAALENQSVPGVIEAARDYGGQAGVDSERLDPWLQQLPAA